jgi:anthranilate phosphoribosyltransferase
MSLRPYLQRVMEDRATLSREEAGGLMQQVFAGGASEVEIAALVGAIAARGETAEELAGFVDAMRAAATAVPLNEAERALLVDTCGTGGDASGTFNISTAAALVAAAAGASVAKHGNRAVTSQCGSADVLEALGIPAGLSPEAAADALREYRFAFLHAPSLHPAMRAVMPVRRGLGVRTVFNVLGPLTNPAGARAQLMGVYGAHLVPLVAEAMRLIGVRHAFVVHGTAEDGAMVLGMDEISISGRTQIAQVRGDEIIFGELAPAQLGMDTAPLEALRGGDARANAEILRAIFAGERGPRRDVVLLNAAAVLIAADAVAVSDAGWHEAFRAGIQLAAAAIDGGAVTKLVATLGEAKR